MKRLLLLAVPCLAISSTLNAANLLDIYNDSKKSDSELAAAQKNLLAQEQVISQADAGLYPQLNAYADGGAAYQKSKDYAGSETDDTYGKVRLGAVLSQVLYDPNVYRTYESSSATYEKAKTDYNSTFIDLYFKTAETYFDILRAKDVLNTTVSQEKAQKRLLDQTQQRYEVGLIAITDVHESKAAYDGARVDRITADGNLNVSFQALSTLTNKTYPFVDGLSEELPIKHINPTTLQEWEDLAIANSLSYISAKQALQINQLNLNIQKSGHLPTLSFSASYNKQYGESEVFNSAESDLGEAKLTLNIPIYQGGAVSAGVDEAQYRYMASKDNLESTRRQLLQRIRSLYITVTNDVDRVQARKLATVSAESALEATTVGYEVGTRTIIEVLQAQQNLYRSIGDYHNARYDYVLNTIRIKQAASTLKEEDLIYYNNWLTGEQISEKDIYNMKPGS